MGAGLADIAALCAPTMALEQVAAIASVQSAVSRLAIRFNSGGVPKLPVDTEEQAVRIATVRIAAGEDLDLGLMGVNGALLKEVGLTVKGAFDPCLNLKAAAALIETYRLGAAKAGVRDADRAALERFVGKGDAGLAPPGVADRVAAEVKGNWKYRARSGAITSRNFAGLSPFYSYPQAAARATTGGRR